MSGKKGVAIPVFGTILIIASVIFLFVLTSAVETKQTIITYKGEIAISGQNRAEIIKKFAEMTDEAVIQEIGSVSVNECGSENLIKELRRSLPRGVHDVDRFRVLRWIDSDLTATPTSAGCLVTGTHTFSLEDDRINMIITENVTINTEY